MLYRNNLFHTRKFAHPNGNMNINNGIENSIVAQSKELEAIPLPNEEIESSIEEKHKRPFASYLDTFMKRVPLEELMLLGLIFLLANESFEDDFLFIILIYILVIEIVQK